MPNKNQSPFKVAFHAVLLLTLSLLSTTSFAQSELSSEVRTTIDKLSSDALARTGVPSASIAVVKDGKIVYLNAYGAARLEPRVPATTSMRYSIGSISKQFTAAAILFLQEQGKLSLDDKVGKYIPDLTRANEVTIRQLLSHTSGYQDYWPQDYVMKDMLKPTTAAKIMDAATVTGRDDWSLLPREIRKSNAARLDLRDAEWKTRAVSNSAAVR